MASKIWVVIELYELTENIGKATKSNDLPAISAMSQSAQDVLEKLKSFTLTNGGSCSHMSQTKIVMEVNPHNVEELESIILGYADSLNTKISMGISTSMQCAAIGNVKSQETGEPEFYSEDEYKVAKQKADESKSNNEIPDKKPQQEDKEPKLAPNAEQALQLDQSYQEAIAQSNMPPPPPPPQMPPQEGEQEEEQDPREQMLGSAGQQQGQPPQEEAQQKDELPAAGGTPLTETEADPSKKEADTEKDEISNNDPRMKMAGLLATIKMHLPEMLKLADKDPEAFKLAMKMMGGALKLSKALKTPEGREALVKAKKKAQKSVKKLKSPVFDHLNLPTDKLVDSELEKMSRPVLGFPKLKAPTRLDQDVRLIETPRQKEIYARAAANGLHPDSKNVPYTAVSHNRETGQLDVHPTTYSTVSNQADRDKEAKSISKILSGKVVGLLSPTKNQKGKSFTAALVGKMRSKAESLPAENDRIRAFNDQAAEWRKEGQKLLLSKPTMQQIDEHNAKMPKLARKKPAKGVETKDLPYDKQLVRNRSIEEIIQHEASHGLFDKLEATHGKVFTARLQQHLLNSIPSHVQNHLYDFLKNLGYKPKSSHFNEEMINLSRDLLVSPHKRKQFERRVGEKAPEIIKELKRSWQDMARKAKAVTPDMDFNKAEELEKGSNQRLFPVSNKYSSTATPTPEFNANFEWQRQNSEDSGDESPDLGTREAIPHMAGNIRHRALNRLHAKTKVRRAKDGKREFLLYRGMDNSELKPSVSNNLVNHNMRTSWTPDSDIAGRFAENAPNGRNIGAWIHEDKIVTVPKHITGHHDTNENGFNDEHEVIVDKNHSSELHSVHGGEEEKSELTKAQPKKFKNLKLPVGTLKDGKLKVKDPASNKTYWRGVRTGLVQAPDGSALSTKRNNQISEDNTLGKMEDKE